MVSRLSSLALALTLAACGANPDTTSELAAQSTSRDAILLDAQATTANGGVNPSMFAVDIKGRVQVGGNPCQARGKTASLVSNQNGEIIEVKAVVTTPDGEPRICTMEYNPVFATVQTTVRGDSRQVQDVLIQNAGTQGATLSAFDLAGINDIVVNDAAHHSITSGIHPDAFAVSITASVDQGSNPCFAANNTVGFVQQVKGDAIYVRAVRKVIDPSRVCTMEYNPVATEITTEVHGLRAEIKHIVLMNVDDLGQETVIPL